MPNQVLGHGKTANLGANIVHGDLQVIGIGVDYTISIGGANHTTHVIGKGGVDVYTIQNAAVSITNTTPLPTHPGQPPNNMTISW